jgi:hypothetical protein
LGHGFADSRRKEHTDRRPIYLSAVPSSTASGGSEGDDLSEDELHGGQLVTTTESILVGDVTDTSGSLAFADLTAVSESEALVPWFRGLDLKGTVEWACSE